MKDNWKEKQNILCIRLDNMGDLLMSSPAIRALKETFRSKITLLTSSMAGGIAKHIPGIDNIIIADVPWVKVKSNEGAAGFQQLVEDLRRQQFDAAVIFTVFSQNPMPAILLSYLAGIPARLAYCRENPYDLLTVWVPDKEPYSLLRHQVSRDLDLVAAIGATIVKDDMILEVPYPAYSSLEHKLAQQGVHFDRQWMIVHPGASETKREYPPHLFNEILKRIIDELGVHIIFTGTEKEKPLTESLRAGIEEHSTSAAGLLSLEELMALIDIAPLLISVNTGTVHIAAALNTPSVVLYAMTNPQHTPWKTPSSVHMFPVDKELQSKNEILRYVTEHVMEPVAYPDPSDVVASVKSMMRIADTRLA